MAIWRGPGGPGDAVPDQANSAQLAENFANAAAASATAASTSASNAAASAAAALVSESNSSSSASQASASESNAAASAAAALVSEQAAAVSEANALASEQAAALSESNAASSESNAAASEANALASEQAAALSESNAASSESNAAASESKAQQWATEAEDVPVETSPTNLYSAFHWAQKSEDFAQTINPTDYVTIANNQTITGVKTFDNGLATDTISEETTAAGVTIDGVLLKDSEVTTDVIKEKTSAAGVTVDGVILKDSQVSTDQINEKTSATGVTIDGVLLKDSEVTTDVIKEKTSATGVTVDSVLLKDGMVVTDSSMNFRNRIINGDMRIDQRNTGASFNTPIGAANTYSLDRWRIRGDSEGVMTVQQSSTAPVGFSKSLSITTQTVDSSIGATQIYAVEQLIEGYNFSDLNWGTANAKTITLSFWVRSSLTGTFGGSLRNNAGDRSYPFSYTISVADTWEYKTITISGETSGTWETTTNAAVWVNFSMGSGSDRLGTAGAWNTNSNFGATGETPVISTLNATWYITGVQLEVGSVATPFERRPYGTELSLCQRYYFKIFPGGTSKVFGTGYAFATTGLQALITYPVPMRTSPAALEQSGTANHYQASDGITAVTCSAVPTYGASTTNLIGVVNTTVSSGLVAGNGGLLRTDSTNGANAYLGWSAEL